MWVRNFLKLFEWGFNVPVFVENPCSGEFKDSAISMLRDKFERYDRLTIIAEKVNAKPRLYLDLTFDSASVFCTELDKAGFDVVVFGNDKWEFSGKLTFRANGYFECQAKRNHFGGFCKCVNYDVNRLAEISCRYRLRELFKLWEKMGVDGLTVYFAWCLDFTGVKCSKLVIYNFMNPKNLLDFYHPFTYIVVNNE